VSDHFDVCGPLPSGTTVLEASAGTGKTFTIAALATRYVAEGHAELHELMLVTFGRAATQELRERVRERLVATERILADPAGARERGDTLVQRLADAPDIEVAERRHRLTRALADFDAATITTTHGFCQQVLTGLGVAGDLEPDATFVESIDDLVVEVVDDLYLRKFGRPGSEPPLLTYDDALTTVRRAVYDPQAALAPDDAEEGTLAHQRHGIAVAARAEVERRKRQRRLLDYDDLVIRLRDALVDPVRGADARARVRARFKVVMVDEFQDTDPAQWEILLRTFHTHTTLVLIGDPKQAIYAFRGGDVETYLQAASVATQTQTLGRNWRSDADLLTALEAVFSQAALGHDEIVVHPVEAEHANRRLSGAPRDAPLRLRVARREQAGGSARKIPRVGPARDLVAQDLAADVVRLLSSGATLHTGERPHPVAPGDVAVLVRTNQQALLVRDSLIAVGVPAVLTGAVNVFSTDMAGEWLVLLQALEQPHRAVRVRTAALGRFVGWSATRLAEAGDDAMDVLGPQLRRWADVLASRGVPALLELITEQGLPGRLLSHPDGERQLTDLRHLAQVLHAAAVADELGVAALVEWLQRRIADAGGDPTEERSRRLESDADAVQVVTVHRSKGLEFPVVYVPYGWDQFKGTPDLLRLHVDGVRTADVGGKDGPRYTEHRAVHEAEDAGEDLRLLYVALTRAQCQVVTWWVPSSNTPCSPLQRLLLGAVAPGGNPEARLPVPSDADVATAMDSLAERAAGTIAVEAVAVAEPSPWQLEEASPGALAVATFGRGLDTAWRRTSYTGLTSAAHHAGPGVASEPEEAQLDDEGDLATAAEADLLAEPLRDVLSPMAGLPSGTAFGITVHSVLETVDTTADDLVAELTGRCREVLDSRLAHHLDPVELGAALLPSMETPLGPLVDDLRLRDVQPADRLAELDFELPLAGGDDPAAAAATLHAVARLLRKRLPKGDLFADYPDRLTGLDDHRLRGYLVGSLDAVLRVRDETGEPSYVVADYKTNWLGGVSAETLSAWHYRPAALTEAMLGAHYPLQALLYCVALHRYLRWRQPGYDPDRHLRGVLYLFVRGMCGAGTPRVDGVPCGVFGWSPPPGLVEELSLLLAGEDR
jgi:exodeoxyribonuclease V beta subunit